MRELEREAHDTSSATPPREGRLRVGVVGPGRLGRALAEALRSSGHVVDGPAGRERVPDADVLVLCVPDAEIRTAAARVAGRAELVGHTSGATPLAALEPAARAGAEVFGMHPLQTFPGRDRDAERFAGAGCAIAGSNARARDTAAALAASVGMNPFDIPDDRRAAYHAAASMASNFLVTLEAAAESVAGAAGLAPEQARRALGPLVAATVENWAHLGPAAALTGPIARGDELTVAAQRAAVERAAPDLLDLFDALAERTRELAGARREQGDAA